MTPSLISLAAVTGLLLAGIAVSFLVLWRAKGLLRAAARRLTEGMPSCEAALDVHAQPGGDGDATAGADDAKSEVDSRLSNLCL